MTNFWRALALCLTLSLAGCTTEVFHAPQPAGDRIPQGDPLSKAVNKYFHYRKLAIIARDPELILSQYPDLRTGTDVSKGINREGSTMVPTGGSRLLDIMYDLDRYEPLRVRHVGDEAIVRVHGLERYIEVDYSDGTAGEFTIDLYMKRAGAEWVVVKTDELTLGELHSR